MLSAQLCSVNSAHSLSRMRLNALGMICTIISSPNPRQKRLFLSMPGHSYSRQGNVVSAGTAAASEAGSASAGAIVRRVGSTPGTGTMSDEPSHVVSSRARTARAVSSATGRGGSTNGPCACTGATTNAANAMPARIGARIRTPSCAGLRKAVDFRGSPPIIHASK